MAIFAFTGAETNSTNELYGSAGTISVQSSIKKTGGYAYRVNPTTTGTGEISVGKFDTVNGTHTNSASGGTSTQVVGFHFYVATLPASASEEILRFSNSGPNIQGHVRITSAGKLQLYNRDGTTQVGSDSTTALSINTWYFIEVSVNAGADGSRTGKIWINGTEEVSTTSGTFAASAADYDYVRFGKTGDRNGQTVDFYYDNIYSSDTRLGESVVERMLLDGNGTYTAFTGGTGTFDYLENDEETPDGVTSYAQSTAASDFETYTFESAASAGVSGTIHAVLSLTFCTRVNTGATSTIRLRSGSTDSDLNVSNYVTGTYAVRGKVFTTDPATTAAWTTSGLDGIEAGMGEQSGSTNRIRMSTVWVNVLFTPAAGSLVKTKLGLAQASIKTFNGLANASTKTVEGLANV